MTISGDLDTKRRSNLAHKGPAYTCQSLVNLCINVVTKDFSRHTREMIYLPPVLKKKLFQIACQRDKVLENIDVLSSLLHPNINEINLTNCDLTTEMIKTISSCHNIEKLHMICNNPVSREAMITLISGLPNLKLLRAKNFSCIDDEFIEILVQHCTLLKILDISRCHITEESLRHLKKLKLTALNASNFAISDDAMNDFLSGECKFTLRELIVCCSRNYGNIAQCYLPKLTIFVNKSDSRGSQPPSSLQQVSWVIPNN